MNKNPNYFAIIPADVRYCTELKANEKLLYGEITALSNKFGYCFAENRYFAELYNVSKETVSRWISNLQKNNFIKTEIKYEPGTKIIEQRLIYISSTSQISDNDLLTKKSIPIDENVKVTIIDNSTFNNIYSQVAEKLNNLKQLLTGYKGKFKPETIEKTGKWIMKSGYTKQQIFEVIEQKFRELSGLKEQNEELFSERVNWFSPYTLFRKSNFSAYIDKCKPWGPEKKEDNRFLFSQFVKKHTSEAFINDVRGMYRDELIKLNNEPVFFELGQNVKENEQKIINFLDNRKNT